MARATPPPYISAVPGCLAEKLRELADLIEVRSPEIVATDVAYSTDSKGHHLTTYTVVQAPRME
ncbi:hypothetical protein [Erwinia sp. 9145]|uniref:hypothetical protein n=1 Tax=Erwinia sp. 9145 TaxID=1500895 RepID=UPI00054E5ED0|nr:hypothetical protein [Erwinia sp. 9145]